MSDEAKRFQREPRAIPFLLNPFLSRMTMKVFPSTFSRWKMFRVFSAMVPTSPYSLNYPSYSLFHKNRFL